MLDPASGSAARSAFGSSAAGPATHPASTESDPGDSGGAGPSGRSFRVRLDNFDGPFDLLLQLISAQRMDVTEIALHRVTDDFIEHIRSMGPDWDLDQATEFLVVAATLLDLKASRLLPGAESDATSDLAALESKDLLFARLLAYRAYQQVAALFAELQATALRRYPRAVALEQRYLGLLPEVRIGLSPDEFAALAAEVVRAQATACAGVDRASAQHSGVDRRAHPCDARAARVLRPGHVHRTGRGLHVGDSGGDPFPRAAEPLSDRRRAVRPGRADGAAHRTLDRGRIGHEQPRGPRGIRRPCYPGS